MPTIVVYIHNWHLAGSILIFTVTKEKDEDDFLK
jgi:hypothetical protein